jgi:hypothetical protein
MPNAFMMPTAPAAKQPKTAQSTADVVPARPYTSSKGLRPPALAFASSSVCVVINFLKSEPQKVEPPRPQSQSGNPTFPHRGRISVFERANGKGIC